MHSHHTLWSIIIGRNQFPHTCGKDLRKSLTPIEQAHSTISLWIIIFVSFKQSVVVCFVVGTIDINNGGDQDTHTDTHKMAQNVPSSLVQRSPPPQGHDYASGSGGGGD